MSQNKQILYMLRLAGWVLLEKLDLKVTVRRGIWPSNIYYDVQKVLKY